MSERGHSCWLLYLIISEKSKGKQFIISDVSLVNKSVLEILAQYQTYSSKKSVTWNIIFCSISVWWDQWDFSLGPERPIRFLYSGNGHHCEFTKKNRVSYWDRTPVGVVCAVFQCNKYTLRHMYHNSGTVSNKIQSRIENRKLQLNMYILCIHSNICLAVLFWCIKKN